MRPWIGGGVHTVSHSSASSRQCYWGIGAGVSTVAAEVWLLHLGVPLTQEGVLT